MANLVRSNAVEETGQELRVPLTDFRLSTGAALAAAAAAGEFGITVGTVFTAGGFKLISEVANGNTKTDTTRMRLSLPQNYVAGENIDILVKVRTSPIANTTATIDVSAFKSDEEGGAGADICATAAQSCNSATWAEKTFTITGTSLSPSDELDVFLQGIVDDSGGTSSAKLEIGGVLISTSTKM